MTESIFVGFPELDTAYLEAAYSDDAETAALVFQQYLQELPSNLSQLHASFRDHDINGFRKYMHRQKPCFCYVGLTDISNKLHELQSKCVVDLDLTIYKNEIEEVLQQINLSANLIEKMLVYLLEQARA